MNLDKYLNREHNSSGYNCLEFAAEVWEDLTGDRRLHDIKFGQPYRHNFEKLDKNEKLCIVIGHKQGPHIGILIEDCVLHCANKFTIYEPLVEFMDHFKRVEFYK